MVVWQLEAARPSSQSSRKSATTSPDQSCPTTSMARHSLLCSYTSQPRFSHFAEIVRTNLVLSHMKKNQSIVKDTRVQDTLAWTPLPL